MTNMDGTTPNRDLWIQPTSSMMRSRWDRVELNGVFSRLLIPFIVGALFYYAFYTITGNNPLAFGISLAVILLTSTVMTFRLLEKNKAQSQSRDIIEKRNRELVDAVRKETDWHPASFNLIFSAAGRGGINIYEGSVDDVLNKVRLWYQGDVLKGEMTCRTGHNPLCKHNAPNFYRWVTSPVEAEGVDETVNP